jgi:hypothetical protein
MISSDPRVDPVRSRADRDEFLRLPWRIYERDPVWVPPLLVERREFIDPRRHPFYRHGSAELVLARRGILEQFILRTFTYARDRMHYTGAELGWTLEDNNLINEAIEAAGGVRYKRYRIYRRPL